MTKLQKTIIIILTILIAGMIITAGIVFASRQNPEVIAGTFVPPEFDPAAITGIPDLSDPGAAYGTLELKPNAIISMCANVHVENHSARVVFTSMKENQGWMKIKLLSNDGTVLGQSGLIRPGEYVEFVELTSVPKQSELVVAKILIYEPDTYYSLGSASAQVMLTL